MIPTLAQTPLPLRQLWVAEARVPRARGVDANAARRLVTRCLQYRFRSLSKLKENSTRVSYLQPRPHGALGLLTRSSDWAGAPLGEKF